MGIDLLVFLIVLSVVVFIHELGHLLAAKLTGVRADEFGFGLPPKALTLFRRGETEYTLNWLPIGGFVRLHGENGEMTGGVQDKRAFWAKPIWQRAFILLAGVFMNFLLGIALFSVVYTILGIPTPTDQVFVAGLEASGPGETAGLKLGDRVVDFRFEKETTKVTSTKQLVELLYGHSGKKVELAVVREDKEQTISVALRDDPERKKGVLGVVLDDVQLKHYPMWQMPFRGMWFGLQEAAAWGKQILDGLWLIMSSLFAGKGVPEGLAGPVGIYQLSSQVREQGVLTMMKFVGILSINLAVLNVMPFPALDGGRLAFLMVEVVFRRKVKQEIEEWVNTAGMLLLLLFMVLITAKDLQRLGFVSKVIEWVRGVTGG